MGAWRGQAAEDAGRVALALLLLDARAVVLLVEIGREELNRRVGSRLPAEGAANRIEVAVVEPVPEEQILRIAVAVVIAFRDADARIFAKGDAVGRAHVISQATKSPLV